MKQILNLLKSVIYERMQSIEIYREQLLHV